MRPSLIRGPVLPENANAYRTGLAFGALTFAAMAILGLGSSVVLARIYGVAGIGGYALVLAATAAVGLLSTLREQEAMVRDIAVMRPGDPAITGRVAIVTALSVGAALVVALVVGALAAWALAGPLDQPQIVAPALVAVVAYALVDRLSWNLDFVFAAHRAGWELFVIRIGSALTLLTGAIGLGLTRGDLWGLVVATIASWAVGLALRLVLVRRYMPLRAGRAELRAGRAALPGYLRFGRRAGGGVLAGTAATEAPVWILAAVAPIAAVGAFSRVQQLVARLVDGLWRITEILYPTLVERRAAGDHEGAERAFGDTIRYAATGLLLMAAGVGGAAHGVMSVFGPGFDLAADALAIMMLGPFLLMLASVQGMLLFAADRPIVTTVGSVSGLALTLGLAVPLSLRFGVTGMAIAILAGQVVDAAVPMASARRLLRLGIRHFWPARQMVALAIAYAAGFAVARLVDASTPALSAVPVAIVAGMAAFAVVVIGLGGINERDRGRLAQIGRGLRRPGANRSVPLASGGER